MQEVRIYLKTCREKATVLQKGSTVAFLAFIEIAGSISQNKTLFLHSSQNVSICNKCYIAKFMRFINTSFCEAGF